tara:strand:+ start:16961 stop:17116 length:156 start_codon:yes stop_codon:yes gene_type:complete
MRTVIFFGMTLISEAVSAQTGHIMGEGTVFFGAMLLLAVVAMDLIDFFKNL